MHEFSLITDLMRKIDVIAREQGARRVVGVKIRLGALSHISPAHFREHFEAAATGTIAEAARLDFEAPSMTADDVTLNYLAHIFARYSPGSGPTAERYESRAY